MTGALGGAVELGGLGERRRRALGGVGEVDDDVGVVERARARSRAWRCCSSYCGSSSPGVSSMTICTSSVGADADDAVAGRLRLGAGDAELLADDAVEERRLAGVRLSDDGDDAGSGHGRKDTDGATCVGTAM